ncbi:MULTISPECIES: GyrI-like domain-containing protein [Bacillaceae]|uniref:GyrI-like domain-containing protein n=1 Tax=Bacillaceae TaxID=186817 RepID=UPI0006FA86DC|nr:MULTISPECIES: GyrI-like domain-containing protein [Bacillaceae]KQL33286.1 transcriptional regulator [Psychrobacillus sp. FJAT-21963]MDF2065164.1 GyrI-like domain-containing protein [Bacillus sp. Cr_A10]
MQYRLVEREAFQVIGVNREFPYDVENGGIEAFQTFWNEIQQDGTLNQLLDLKSGDINGLLGIWAEVSREKNRMNYYVAAEYDGTNSTDFQRIDFPASKWVVFEVQGPFPSAIANTWERIFSEWFPSNPYELSSIKPFEVYLDTNIYKTETYNEIWVPVK